MKIRKMSTRALALVMTLVLVLALLPAMAFAAEDGPQLQDGTGTVNMVMLHEKKDQPSMCDILFGAQAAVTVKGDTASLSILVVNPVPGFPDQGADGTIKDFTVTYAGKTYTAVSDMETKPMMTAKASNPMFGLQKGQEYPAQVLTLELPKEALLEEMLTVDAYVNVVMNTNMKFRMGLSGLELNAEPQKPAIQDGVGTVNITMLHEKKDQPSMCDILFGAQAAVTVKGDTASIGILVVNPVPSFPDEGADGTIKDFTVTYAGKTYTAASDMETKPMMTAKDTNPMFGIQKGQEYPAQVLTLELPKEALLEEMLTVDAYVNVVMNTNMKFRMALGDLQMGNPPVDPDPDIPDVPQMPSMVLVDEATGVRVNVDEGILNEDVELVVEVLTEGEDFEAAQKLAKNGQTLTVYRLKLVNPDGTPAVYYRTITVAFPVTDNTVAVYRLTADGSTLVKGQTGDNMFSALQKELGVYAVIEGQEVEPTDPEKPVEPQDPTDPEKPEDPTEKPTVPEKPVTPQTGDSMPLGVLIAIVAVAGVAVVGIIVYVVVSQKKSSR